MTINLSRRKYQIIRVVDGRTVTKDRVIYNHADIDKMMNRLDYLNQYETGWGFRVVDGGYKNPWS